MNRWTCRYTDPQGDAFPVVIEAPDAVNARIVWERLHPPQFGYSLNYLEESPDAAIHVGWSARGQAVIDIVDTDPLSRVRFGVGLLVLLVGVAGGMALGYSHGMRVSAHDPLPWSLAGFGTGVLLASIAAWRVMRIR